jgi:hypothetical protein
MPARPGHLQAPPQPDAASSGKERRAQWVSIFSFAQKALCNLPGSLGLRRMVKANSRGADSNAIHDG